MNREAVHVEKVARRGLCSSCGTCAGLCPRSAIAMPASPQGIFAPSVDREACNGCGLCLRVCPGAGLPFAELTRRTFGSLPEDATLGHVRGIWAAHAADEALRWRTQSGGAVSALLLFMLEQKLIDGAAVTRWKAGDPLATETVIARTPGEVLSAAGSKYLPVPAGQVLREILRSEGRFAFVGTPCQMHGLRKAEAVMPRLRDRIAVRLGLHCLGVFCTHFLDHILARAGTSRGQVSSFQFRSKEPWGWPCHMRIETRSGAVVNLRGKYSRLAPRPYFTPCRCLLCFDKLNELADLSFGDCRVARHYGVRRLADLGPRKEPGLSDVVVRTRAGEEFLDAAVKAGRLRLEATTARELGSTTKVAEKKLGVRDFSLSAPLLGLGRPEYDVSYAPRAPGERLLLAALRPFSLLAAWQLAAGSRLLSLGIYRRLLRATPHALFSIATAIRDRTTGPGLLAGTEVVARPAAPSGPPAGGRP